MINNQKCFIKSITLEVGGQNNRIPKGTLKFANFSGQGTEWEILEHLNDLGEKVLLANDLMREKNQFRNKGGGE